MNDLKDFILSTNSITKKEVKVVVREAKEEMKFYDRPDFIENPRLLEGLTEAIEVYL